jgi:hypothetical protein
MPVGALTGKPIGATPQQQPPFKRKKRKCHCVTTRPKNARCTHGQSRRGHATVVAHSFKERIKNATSMNVEQNSFNKRIKNAHSTKE